MQEKRLLRLVLVFVLVLSPAFVATSLFAAKKPPPPEKILRGFRGEAKLIARQWLRHEKKITALEFIPGEKGRFWNMGSLQATLVDGRRVSIDAENDFSGRNPGLIRDDLDALKFKIETSALSTREYRELLARKIELDKRLTSEQKILEKEIQQEIALRLEDALEEELLPVEKLTLKKMRKRYERAIKRRITSEIENEVKRDFPNAGQEKLKLEIAARLDRQGRQRIKKALRKKIMALSRSGGEEAPEMEIFTKKTVALTRARITAQVRAEFAAKKSRELNHLRRIARGGHMSPRKKQDNVLEKLKKMLGWDRFGVWIKNSLPNIP
ncbi:MAG: hypothetical protein ACE5G9_03805 [Nitrospinales bacterium]